MGCIPAQRDGFGPISGLDWLMITDGVLRAKVVAAANAFVDDLVGSLPPGSGIQEIELAIMQHSREMLRLTAQALVDAKGFSPGTDQDS